VAFENQVPGGVQAKPSSPFAATVSWQPVPGARYYNVYAGDQADFTPSQANLLYSPAAGDEKTIDWGLKPGTTYFYKVVAVDYDGTASKPNGGPTSVTTLPLDSKLVELEYESGTGAPCAMTRRPRPARRCC